VTGNRHSRAAGGSLAVGTVQEDDIKAHSHTQNRFDENGADGSVTSRSISQGAWSTKPDFLAGNTGSTGGAENKVKAIAVYKCVWY
jgi:hypothetical protein